MSSIIWLIAIVVGVVAFIVLVSSFVASVRAARLPLVVLSALLNAGFFAVLWFVPSAYLIILVSALMIPLALLLVSRGTRSSAQGQQVMKLSAAHVTLLFGSLMFLIPFAWLISTSLKPDDEQAAFPPIWIPTQQVNSEVVKGADGKPAPLSWFEKDTPKAQQVAEVAELPSGNIVVQPINAVAGPKGDVAAKAEGATFEVSRGQLDKIRTANPRWQNYADALEFLPPETHYGLTFLLNTLFLTLMSVIGTVISSSLVAYAFARLRWPGKNLLFVVLLATMMVPGAVTLMPQFLIFRSLGWVDTLLPLWVPAFFAAPFNVFLLRQFFMSIPGELEDAAKIDGCGPLGTYWRIMLPQVKPALAAISILSIMGAWNNFQGPLIYISSPEKMPLAYALQLYQQQHGGEPGLLMAASTLVVLPIIVLFFFSQRYFIEGVSLSGLGGR